jgi:hypothetical protein
MKRYLMNYILDDLTGTSHSGKTTLSKILSNNFDYLNFDNPEHRLGSFLRFTQLTCFTYRTQFVDPTLPVYRLSNFLTPYSLPLTAIFLLPSIPCEVF